MNGDVREKAMFLFRRSHAKRPLFTRMLFESSRGNPGTSSTTNHFGGKRCCGTSPGNEDFFGIWESEGGSGGRDEKLSDAGLSQKYSYTKKESKFKGADRGYGALYGFIRLDKDNRVRASDSDERGVGDPTRGECPPLQARGFSVNVMGTGGKHVGRNTMLLKQGKGEQQESEIRPAGMDLFDERHFQHECGESFDCGSAGEREEEPEVSYIDRTYFGKETFDEKGDGARVWLKGRRQGKSLETGSHHEASAGSSTGFIEEQYFGSSENEDCGSETENTGVVLRNVDRSQGPAGNDGKSTNTDQVSSSDTSEGLSVLRDVKVMSDQAIVPGHGSNAVTNRSELIKARIRKSKAKPNAPESSYDLAMKIRQDIKRGLTRKSHGGDKQKAEKHVELVDSKGFRILKDQVPDLLNMPSFEIVNLLKNSIIYDQDDLVAIDKPYGLPSHGGPGVHVSVAHVLPELARHIDKSGQLETLHLIHRLDKETTGVLLLAKSPEMAWKLNGMFKRQEVIKKYWTITKGIPKPKQGIIDIPMAEGTVQGNYRMTLKPYYTEETKLVMKKSFVHTHKAITNYRVLDSTSCSALVECQPETGVKHQIRTHLAFGLNTQVLGDHKYSHFFKLAPQRLFPEMLHLLGIRQSKVRHLPMHLHAKLILLPEFNQGRNVFISALLPRHFVINMRRLKLKPPK